MDMFSQRFNAKKEFSRQVVDLQAQEVLDLGEEDDDRNTIGETDDHGHRNEADELPQSCQAHGQQKEAGQHGGAEQVGETMYGDDAVDDGDEGAGRAADLDPRAAK